MLSAASANVVRVTLPAIGAAIGDITPVFYRRMFAAHPDLERDLFNRGNQARGDQQRALAGSIAAYAALLVSEDGPDPREVLPRIAHKHASLGIPGGLYQVVHDHLFAAIAEVLGEAATPEITAAWDEVYWDMARALIGIESGLYAERGASGAAGPEPGRVWRTLTVRRRVQQTPDVVSFTLSAPDETPLPAGRPGQYVSVAVGLPDGARQIRQYSLTRAPAEDAVRISVKAIPADGAAPAGEVSNFLHRNVFEGDELQVSAPSGEMTLAETDSPLVLASAGIGITPMIAFLRHLHRIGSPRPVIVLHADRSAARHAHRAELTALTDRLSAAVLHRWYEDTGTRSEDAFLHGGLIDLGPVWIPAGADAYLCGPVPFMTAVRGSLIDRGIEPGLIRYEVFGPSRELEAV